MRNALIAVVGILVGAGAGYVIKKNIEGKLTTFSPLEKVVEKEATESDPEGYELTSSQT